VSSASEAAGTSRAAQQQATQQPPRVRAISSTGHTCRGRVKQKSHKSADLVEAGSLRWGDGKGADAGGGREAGHSRRKGDMEGGGAARGWAKALFHAALDVCVQPTWLPGVWPSAVFLQLIEC